MADDAKRATFNITAPNLKLDKIINRYRHILFSGTKIKCFHMLIMLMLTEENEYILYIFSMLKILKY
jgi:hypothetical protein